MSNEKEISTKITRYLDSGTAELKAGTAYRLQLAREAGAARVSATRGARPSWCWPARAAARSAADAIS